MNIFFSNDQTNFVSCEEEEEEEEQRNFFQEEREERKFEEEREETKNFVCVLSKKKKRKEIQKKKKNFRSTLFTFTSTHTTNVRIVVPSSVFILHENKNNRVLRIRILRMTEVPTKVHVAFEKENVSSKGVPNLPSPPSPLGDEIQNDELDEEEEEEEEERATIEEAAIEKTKEQNDDDKEEEEDFIRIKRRVRGTNEKEEERRSH